PGVELPEIGPVRVVAGEIPRRPVGHLRDVDVALPLVDRDRVRLPLAKVDGSEEGADLLAVEVEPTNLEVPVVADQDLVGDRVVGHPPRVDAGLSPAAERANE